MGRRLPLRALTVLACTLIAACAARAQTWDGGGANNLWSNGLNWTGVPDNTAPISNGSATAP